MSINNMKKKAFIIDDSMIKKVDGYLLTNSIKHKYLVTVRSFLAAKAVNMFDYVKPIQRDFDPVAYILHIGTNDLTRKKNETKSAQKYNDLSRFLKQINTK